MFFCNKCGECCRHIDLIKELKGFDAIGGVCKYLTRDNLCAIYDKRPLICNVDKYYSEHLKNEIPLSKWYEINEASCKAIMKNTASNLKR